MSIEFSNVEQRSCEFEGVVKSDSKCQTNSVLRLLAYLFEAPVSSLDKGRLFEDSIGFLGLGMPSTN